MSLYLYDVTKLDGEFLNQIIYNTWMFFFLEFFKTLYKSVCHSIYQTHNWILNSYMFNMILY